MRRRLSSPSNHHCSNAQKACYIIQSYQLTDEASEAAGAEGSPKQRSKIRGEIRTDQATKEQGLFPFQSSSPSLRFSV